MIAKRLELAEGWFLQKSSPHATGYWLYRTTDEFPDGESLWFIDCNHTSSELEDFALTMARQKREGAAIMQEEAARYCETADGLPINKPPLAEDLAPIIRGIDIDSLFAALAQPASGGGE